MNCEKCGGTSPNDWPMCQWCGSYFDKPRKAKRLPVCNGSENPFVTASVGSCVVGWDIMVGESNSRPDQSAKPWWKR